MTRNGLKIRLREANIIQTGRFTARSGEKLDFYCDLKFAFGFPHLLNTLADEIGQRLLPGTTCIAASGYGGLPLGAVVASRFKLRFIAVRNEVKNHGKRGRIDGYVPGPHDSAAIVDDVLTTGHSIMATATILKRAGIKVGQAVVVVKRTEVKLPIPYSFVFHVNDLMLPMK